MFLKTARHFEVSGIFLNCRAYVEFLRVYRLRLKQAGVPVYAAISPAKMSAPECPAASAGYRRGPAVGALREAEESAASIDSVASSDIADPSSVDAKVEAGTANPRGKG